MEPQQLFKIGDKVKKKNKSKIYTIKEAKYSHYSKRWWYILEEDKRLFWYESQLKGVNNDKERTGTND